MVGCNGHSTPSLVQTANTDSLLLGHLLSRLQTATTCCWSNSRYYPPLDDLLMCYSNSCLRQPTLARIRSWSSQVKHMFPRANAGIIRSNRPVSLVITLALLPSTFFDVSGTIFNVLPLRVRQTKAVDSSTHSAI